VVYFSGKGGEFKHMSHAEHPQHPERVRVTP